MEAVGLVAPYSVVVPVWNEAAVLPRTVPALLHATRDEAPELVFVCNGCRDASAAVLRGLLAQAAGRVTVIELPRAGKAAALNAGDALATAFPRFYLDADVEVTRDCFRVLVAALDGGAADLVAPAIEFDTAHASRVARAIAGTWLALPHGREGAFHHLLGLSAPGRARWGAFPEILGDDIFIEAMTPADRRCVIRDATVRTRPPGRFWAWVRVRARWLRGERQLAALGIPVQRVASQRGDLWRRLLSPATAPGTMAFVLARLLAGPVDRVSGAAWYADRR